VGDHEGVELVGDLSGRDAVDGCRPLRSLLVGRWSSLGHPLWAHLLRERRHPDRRQAGKITLLSPKGVSSTEALDLLRSALALHGYSLLSQAEATWIVPCPG
jgi:hypothetical protein